MNIREQVDGIIASKKYSHTQIVAELTQLASSGLEAIYASGVELPIGFDELDAIVAELQRFDDSAKAQTLASMSAVQIHASMLKFHRDTTVDPTILIGHAIYRLCLFAKRADGGEFCAFMIHLFDALWALQEPPRGPWDVAIAMIQAELDKRFS